MKFVTVSCIGQLWTEIKIHYSLEHPNIICFHDCFEDGDIICFLHIDNLTT